jgi:hypothetical protein
MLVIRDSNYHESSVGDISQLTMMMANRLPNELVEIGRIWPDQWVRATHDDVKGMNTAPHCPMHLLLTNLCI